MVAAKLPDIIDYVENILSILCDFYSVATESMKFTRILGSLCHH